MGFEASGPLEKERKAMRKVLLLNANGEALNFIPWTRALNLVLKQRVHVYEFYEDEVRSQRSSHKIPAVVGLVKYVMVPRADKVRLNRLNLLVRDSYTCQYCGKSINRANATIDHVKPLSKGGKHEWTNVVAACKPCNGKKADRTLEASGLSLRTIPWKPSRKLILKEKAEQLGVLPQIQLYFGRT